MNDWGAHSDAAHEALAALVELRHETDDPGITHEVLGRLCWLAPDAVLEAVEQSRRSAAERARNAA